MFAPSLGLQIVRGGDILFDYDDNDNDDDDDDYGNDSIKDTPDKDI